jgi:Uma2 family endonuclease
VAGPAQGQWTYADYAALPEDGKRYEIIEGVLYMPPSPNFSHQGANILFAHYLVVHVKLAGLGWVLAAPFDVELSPGNVVQPDILVVLKANEERIKPGKLVGAPDLVVEIASPGTASYDRREKQDAYASAGVPEYWIADPAAKTIEVLVLEQGAYKQKGVFEDQNLLQSQIIPELPVKVAQFFA